MRALLSPDRKYRYVLYRECSGPEKPLLFVMLNPSTADEETDDATIHRCRGFAEREQACGFFVLNLFAYRATKPADLWKEEEPVGALNDTLLAHFFAAFDKAIFAWGAQGKRAEGRARRIGILARENNCTPYCLAKTDKGDPRHPLYLPADSPLQPY